MRRAAVIVALCCGFNAGAASAQPLGPHDPIAHVAKRTARAGAVLAGTVRASTATRRLRFSAISGAIVASASGRARSVAVYVAPGSTAATLEVIVAAGAGHRIGRTLRRGRVRLHGRTGWVSVRIGALPLTRGQRYWITVAAWRGTLVVRTAGACTGATGVLPVRCRLSAFMSAGPRAVTASAASASGSATSTTTTAVDRRPAPPAMTSPPVVSGTPAQGRTLSTTTGTWTERATYAYQWRDCTTTCQNISGATAATYTLGAADVGRTVDAVVTATDTGGSATAVSAPTATIIGLPVNTAAPTVYGTPVEGQTLTATAGTWSATPLQYSYQWQDCSASCTSISGATAPAYTLTAGDVGDTIDVLVTAANSAGSASAASARSATVTAVSSAAGIHVSGNQLLNASGSVVRLRGVVRSGSEYMCSEGYGIFDGPTGSSEFQPMLSWDINTVFIGLNEDCWLGINGINPSYSGTNYINAIKSEVTAAESAGLYPVLGWFWGDPGTEVPTGNDPNGGGQPALPDNDHAPLFWQQLAQTFRGDPNVVFRLQEEPHPSASGPGGAGASTSGGFGTGTAQWQCWAQGSVQYSTSGDSSAWSTAPTPTATTNNCEEYATNGSTLYRTVGMQSLINIIRGAGASNVIQVPGIGYANMLACSPTQSPTSCGFLDSTDGVALHDPLGTPQLMADVDVYPDAGQVCSSTSCYDTTYAPVAAQMPLDAGEVGPNGSVDTNTNAFLDWMDSKGANYYAWVWDTWGSLISNYNGTPDSPWGTAFQQRLTGQSAPTPAQPTDGITLSSQATGCTNPTSATITLSHAVSAGDDLFLVTGGGGYTAAASTVTGVSDNVNGAWQKLTNSGSQLGGNQEYASYAVYELIGARAAAANALTITLTGAWGQSGMSTVVTDASGVSSVGPSTFDSTIAGQTSTWTSSPLTPLAGGDVVLGLFANYSHAGDSMTAPSGWNTDSTKTVNTSNCAGASVDWTQTTGTSPLAASIDDSSSEYHYSGAIDLHP